MMDWTLTKEAIVLLQNYYPEQYVGCSDWLKEIQRG